jgi:hypothetical protein
MAFEMEFIDVWLVVAHIGDLSSMNVDLDECFKLV